MRLNGSELVGCWGCTWHHAREMQYLWQYSDAHTCRYTVKTWGDKSGKTCVTISLQLAYSTHCTGQRSRLITAHGGHTEEWTVVMGYLCIQTRWFVPVLCMALYCHINFPPPTPSHDHTHTKFQSTHVFSIFQPYSTRDCNKIHRPLQIANITTTLLHVVGTTPLHTSYTAHYILQATCWQLCKQ